MTDLVSAVPPHEPAEDTLAFAGKAALSAIPLVGGIATEALSHALDSRQAQRQHEFNVTIARALTAALEGLDASLTIEDVVASDEFIAGVTRAQRVASETASEAKRRRLASAVANGGSWAPFSASERAQFTRLVDEFDELHVFLLQYFVDPKGWLEARGLYEQHSNILMGGIGGPLASALGAPKEEWAAPVNQAVADLGRTGLAEIPLKTSMGPDGVFAPRTSQKGQRFLAFIGEPPAVEAEPPSAL